MHFIYVFFSLLLLLLLLLLHSNYFVVVVVVVSNIAKYHNSQRSDEQANEREYLFDLFSLFLSFTVSLFRSKRSEDFKTMSVN